MSFSLFVNMEKAAIEIIEYHLSLMTNNNILEDDDCADRETFEMNYKNGFIIVTMISNLMESSVNSIVNRKINCSEEKILKMSIETKLLLISIKFNFEYDPSYITHKWGDILNKFSLSHIRFHELRHSSASFLISKGFGLKDIQEWLGHADIKLTANTYSHLDVERKNSLAEAFSSSFC